MLESSLSSRNSAMRSVFLLMLLWASLSFGDDLKIQIARQCVFESYPTLKTDAHFLEDFLGSLDSGMSVSYKTEQEYERTLQNPRLVDTFIYPYPLDSFANEPFEDSARLRDYTLLEFLYGDSKSHVELHLKSLKWVDGHSILFNVQNGAYESLERVRNRLQVLLEENPQYLDFLKNIGGTYLWRKIAHTKRLSPHSFGIAIDINVAHSRYWLWDLQRHPPQRVREFGIPQDIIEAFEQEGFIWGGRWWHYDSMHFEYRPEILCYAERLRSIAH